MTEKINIGEKFSCFNDYWNPRIVGELNGQYIKLVKTKGEFTWHKHDDEDELFLVIKGILTMELRNKTIELKPGEFIIIPRGMEHKPVAAEEAHIMLFEPKSTLNTGDKQNEFTKPSLEKL
jgi:mannose-6-phosphate isomerase-like protein (cupin superfamily)